MLERAARSVDASSGRRPLNDPLELVARHRPTGSAAPLFIGTLDIREAGTPANLLEAAGFSRNTAQPDIKVMKSGRLVGATAADNLGWIAAAAGP